MVPPSSKYEAPVSYSAGTYKTPSVHLPALVELYDDRILLTLKVVGLVIPQGHR